MVAHVHYSGPTPSPLHFFRLTRITLAPTHSGCRLDAGPRWFYGRSGCDDEMAEIRSRDRRAGAARLRRPPLLSRSSVRERLLLENIIGERALRPEENRSVNYRHRIPSSVGAASAVHLLVAASIISMSGADPERRFPHIRGFCSGCRKARRQFYSEPLVA